MDGLNQGMGDVALREDVYGTPDAGLWASAPQVHRTIRLPMPAAQHRVFAADMRCVIFYFFSRCAEIQRFAILRPLINGSEWCQRSHASPFQSAR